MPENQQSFQTVQSMEHELHQSTKMDANLKHGMGEDSPPQLSLSSVMPATPPGGASQASLEAPKDNVGEEVGSKAPSLFCEHRSSGTEKTS